VVHLRLAELDRDEWLDDGALTNAGRALSRNNSLQPQMDTDKHR